jgi:hypothetical protein
MCIMKSYETRGRNVVEPPPRVGNFTSHAPAGVMRLPREWRREESVSDDGRYVEYRYAVLFLLCTSTVHPYPCLNEGRTILMVNYNQTLTTKSH